MTEVQEYKKFAVRDVFVEAGRAFHADFMAMGIFSVANFVLLALSVYGVGGTKHPLFLLLLLLMYVFWGVFFRFYFQKKPYLQLKPFVRSLVPSIKVVFVTVVVVWAFMLLPYIPLLFGLSSDNLGGRYLEKYLFFLQKYMQDTNLVDLGIYLSLVFVMPLILFRPLLAWVAAILGRRGSLTTAWSKTKNNYWQFAQIAFLMNIPMLILDYLADFSRVTEILSLLFFAPLMVYYNLVIARIYDFFYQD